MKVDVIYAIENKVLIIVCAHGSLGARTVSGKIGAQPWQKLLNREILAPSLSLIANALEDAFNEIKKTDAYKVSVSAVVFASDVNLGFSGSTNFPSFLYDDFIENNFNPHPVKKVLFSTTQDIVNKAASTIKSENVWCVKSGTTKPNEVQEAIGGFYQELMAEINSRQAMADELSLATLNLMKASDPDDNSHADEVGDASCAHATTEPEETVDSKISLSHKIGLFGANNFLSQESDENPIVKNEAKTMSQ